MEIAMRPVDLYHDQRIKAVDLCTICELMLAIERGEVAPEGFFLAEPDLGPTIVYVAGVVLLRSGASGWILHRERRRDHFYLAMGTRRAYLECMFYGAPMPVRAACLLSLDEAVTAIEKLINGEKLAPPLHWVSQMRAFKFEPL
jgi:hypothetical protein